MRFDEKTLKLHDEIKGLFATEKIGYDVQIGYLFAMGAVIFIDGTVILNVLSSGLIEVSVLRYDLNALYPPIEQVGAGGRLQFGTADAVNLALHEIETSGYEFPMSVGTAVSGFDFGRA